ncbi:stimulated by retinoic acid 13, isoform CRA_c [Mus musculus]|nr:stimulated by retinoic acid 13, isoform CRA_c [Mus musculus]
MEGNSGFRKSAGMHCSSWRSS